MNNIRLSGILILLFLACHINGFSQYTFLPLNSASETYIQRLEIRSGQISNECFTGIRPYSCFFAQALFDSTRKGSDKGYKVNKYNYKHFQLENYFLSGADSTSKRGIFKTFYRSSKNLFQVKTNGFLLEINPVFHFHGGKETDVDEIRFIDTRGLEACGMVDNKVGFYIFMTENQAIYPSYINNFIHDNHAIPGEGYYNPFKTTGVDYYSARGYITFNATKHINIQLGQDKNFIGNGYRSLFLSDFSNAYPFLKISTQVWKIHYQNLFTQFIAGDDHVLGIPPFKKKYAAFHYLSIDLLKKVRLGLFEGVIFSDSTGTRGYEISYLNPVIFYKSVERDMGSPDNTVIGLDLNIIPFKNVALYGQLLLDELRLDIIKNDFEWWGNKYGIQAGVKYTDALTIRNLNIQVEFNTVRPYTYSHVTDFTNYAHYNQALAHPLGANFREFVTILSYQPLPRFQVNLRWTTAIKGSDTSNSNYGGDMLKSYGTRTKNENNYTGQGINNQLNNIEAVLSYEIMHNTYFELVGLYRDNDSEINSQDAEMKYIGLSFRMNFPYRWADF